MIVACLFLYRFALLLFFFFFNDTATTEIYTLSLHDALPISFTPLRYRALASGYFFRFSRRRMPQRRTIPAMLRAVYAPRLNRSEEHTSELQSQSNLVCRLLLEKKKKKKKHSTTKYI